MSLSAHISEKAALIWAIADKLTGVYKPHEYGEVILPLTVIRRFDCILADTKDAVLAKYEQVKTLPMRDVLLRKASGRPFYNTSRFTFERLLDDPDNIEANFRDYLNGFSENVQDILAKFKFDGQITTMAGKGILYIVLKEFTSPKANLHPDVISNLEMGYIFEEIIRRFSESHNEDAGQHYTPREVIQLMVNILFYDDNDVLSGSNVVKTLYDPACGTGGMLSVAEEYLHHLNASTELVAFGQELNDQTFAICKADMFIKGNNADFIKDGNTLSDDQFAGQRFDYILSNPPFGREWKNEKAAVEAEAKRGFAGRFGPGLPAVSDGQMLFLLTAVSKMKEPQNGGSRIAIIHNGSPLFTGDAGSGPSEIRRYILENDLLEAIVALPNDIFYNTGIATYIWVLSNKKAGTRREGKVQLIDATEIRHSMRKNQGEKRYELTREDREEIVRLYSEFDDSDPRVQIYDYREFEYREYTVIQPMRRNYAIMDERIDAMLAGKALSGVWDEEAIAKLQAKAGLKPSEQKKLAKLMGGRPAYDAIVVALRSAVADEVFVDPKPFGDRLRDILKGCGVPTALRRKLVEALSERDESAPIQKDRHGNVVYDKSTKDTERVPMLENVEEYMEHEVYPYVPDAHVIFEENLAAKKPVIKTGAEIPFTRYFYKYQEPENPESVLAEVLELDERASAALVALKGGE